MKTKAVVFAGVAIVALLQASAIHAQNTRNSGQRSSQNVTYQTATTKSGRTVILKSDGTWVYADDDASTTGSGSKTPVPAATTKPTTARGSSNLNIETGIVMQNGDVKPLARTTFYLLDADLESILQNGGFRPANVGGMATFGYSLASGNILSTFLLAWRYNTMGVDKESYQRALSLISPHVKAKTTTNFKGNAEFAGVAPGVYYLAAWDWLNNQGMLWSLKTNLKSGANSITVDQNNAALVGGGD